MVGLLYPHEYAQSVFSIDYPRLFELGYKGIIFDIDNTLVHHGRDATPEVSRLIDTLRGQGFKILLLTNNSEDRALRFLSGGIEASYICEAGKPKPSGYLRGLVMLGLEPAEAVFIGDQIFTDILGANMAGIKNILVRYIRDDRETRIGMRRRIENMILWTYSRSKRYQHRLGNIEKRDFRGRI